MSEIINVVLVRKFTAENPAFGEEYYRIPDEDFFPYIRRVLCGYTVGDNRGNMRIFSVKAVPEDLDGYQREDFHEEVKLEVWRSAHGKKALVVK